MSQDCRRTGRHVNEHFFINSLTVEIILSIGFKKYFDYKINEKEIEAEGKQD